MSDKVTTMVLKVDLHCSRCYEKIKKVLCKVHQIRNQEYDEKVNTVTITVVCCNPEKMREKLRCKGRKTIKSIEIIEKTKETEKKTEKEQKVDRKTEESGNGKETEKTNEKEKQKVDEKSKKSEEDKEVPPGRVCCGHCFEGHYGGPCYQGYGRPVPCYVGCRCRCGCGYRYRYEYGYCKTKICYVSRCDYFNEENTSGCTIM